MKNNLLLIICGLTLIMSSCAKVYSPAMYHQDIAYQPKPTSFDAKKSLTYVSGGLNVASSNNYSDDKVSGELDISRGHAFQNFNLAYGAFGSFGSYENSSIDKGQPNYFTNKSFGAIGGRASANVFVTSGKTDFRIIGFEAAYSHEFGDYADYRNYLNGQPDFHVDPRTDLFTLGLTTEVVFHKSNDDSFQQGIRGFLGKTFGYNNADVNYNGSDNTFRDNFFHGMFPKASYFITFKDYFGIAEVGNGVFIRFGYKF